MVAKRALIVDDSKSARAFLARLLEEQQLEVDSAETAEQALDYLVSNRPDVIFMDHLMPGMDGFQAVQAIKANPRTAMIPILMYTSQEGELYLGQARALGAAGVLSKSLAPADVRTALRQLHLLAAPEQPAVVVRKTAAEAAADAAAEAESSVQTASLPGLPHAASAELLKEELAALRRHLAEALEAHHQNTVRLVRRLVPEAPPVRPDSQRQVSLPWYLAVAASVAAAVLGALLWQNQQQLEPLRTELADSRSTVSMLAARLGPAPAAAGGDTAAAAAELVLRVPFGEAPLAGARVDALRGFVARVAELEQQGTVDVRHYAGRFCLSSRGTQGYALADGATPYINCDLVADASDQALGNTSPESAPFTTALAELRRKYAELLTFDVGMEAADTHGSPYPEVGGTPPRVPTAGEWNDVAASNNRVEFRWHPAP